MGTGDDNLLQLLLWANGGVPTEGMVRFLMWQMVGGREQDALAGTTGQRDAGSPQDAVLIRRRHICELLVRLLPACGGPLATEIVSGLRHLSEQSPASVALLARCPLWELLPAAAQPGVSGKGFPSSDVFRLLSDVSLYSLGCEHVQHVLDALFFSTKASELSQHLMLCKRLFASSARSAEGTSDAQDAPAIQHFFSFTGKELSGLTCPPRAWPEKGFTFSASIFPHSLANEPRVFHYSSVSATYVECFLKPKAVVVVTRKGETQHTVEIACPQLVAKVWTKLTVSLKYHLMYSSVATVYINSVEVGHANLKYPVVKSGDKPLLRLMSLGKRRNAYCGLSSSIVVLREAVSDLLPHPEVDPPPASSAAAAAASGSGASTSGGTAAASPSAQADDDAPASKNARTHYVWHHFTPTKCSRRVVLDSSYSGESRVFHNAERTAEVTCHTLVNPLDTLKRAGGARLFVFLLKRLSISFHSIAHLCKKRGHKLTLGGADVRMAQAPPARARRIDVTSLRDCVVTTVELVCELCAVSGAVGQNGFGLISLVLQSLPSEMLPLHLVRIFGDLITATPSSVRPPRLAMSEAVLRHVLFGVSGVSIWSRASYDAQRSVYEKVLAVITKRCFFAFASDEHFAEWFETRVVSVPVIVEQILPLFYLGGTAEGAVSPNEMAVLRSLILGVVNRLMTAANGSRAHVEALAKAAERAGSKGGDTAEKELEDILRLLLEYAEVGGSDSGVVSPAQPGGGAGASGAGAGGAGAASPAPGAALAQTSSSGRAQRELLSVLQGGGGLTPLLVAFWGHPSNTIKMLSIKLYVAVNGMCEPGQNPSYSPVIQITENCGPETDVHVYTALKEAAIGATSSRTSTPEEVPWQAIRNPSVILAMLSPVTSQTLHPYFRRTLARDLVVGLENDPKAALKYVENLPLHYLFRKSDRTVDEASMIGLIRAFSKPLLQTGGGANFVHELWVCVNSVWGEGIKRRVQRQDSIRAVGEATVAAAAAVTALSALFIDDDEAFAAQAPQEAPQRHFCYAACDPIDPDRFIVSLFTHLYADVADALGGFTVLDYYSIKNILTFFAEMLCITQKVLDSIKRRGVEVPTATCIQRCLDVFHAAARNKLTLVESHSFERCDEDTLAAADGSDAPFDSPCENNSPSAASAASASEPRKFTAPPPLTQMVSDTHFHSGGGSGSASSSPSTHPPPGLAPGGLAPRSPAMPQVPPSASMSYNILLRLALSELRRVLSGYVAAAAGGEPAGDGGGSGGGAATEAAAAAAAASAGQRQADAGEQGAVLRRLCGELRDGACSAFHGDLAGYLERKVVELHGQFDEDRTRVGALCDVVRGLLEAMLDGVGAPPASGTGAGSGGGGVKVQSTETFVVSADVQRAISQLCPVLQIAHAVKTRPLAGAGSGGGGGAAHDADPLAQLCEPVIGLLQFVFLTHSGIVSQIQDATNAPWLTLDVAKWCGRLTDYIAVHAAGFENKTSRSFVPKDPLGFRNARLKRRSEVLLERMREDFDIFMQDLGLLRGKRPASAAPASPADAAAAAPAAGGADASEVSYGTMMLHADWEALERRVMDAMVLRWWLSPSTCHALPPLEPEFEDEADGGSAGGVPFEAAAAKQRPTERVFWRVDHAGYRCRLVRYPPPPAGVLHASSGRDYRKAGGGGGGGAESARDSAEILRMSVQLPRGAGDEACDAGAGDADDDDAAATSTSGEGAMQMMHSALDIGGAAVAAEGSNLKVAECLGGGGFQQRFARVELVTLEEGRVRGELVRADAHIMFVVDKAEVRGEGGIDGEVVDLLLPIPSIKAVYHRRHFLQPNSMEVFVESEKLCAASYFFAFESQAARDDVLKSLTKPRLKGVLSVLPYITRGPPLTWRTPSETMRRLKITEKWVKNQISNFDYILELNYLAGRTFNDVNQYPIFPWVLCDYTSQHLDLSDPSVYRDLSKPVGALNPTRLAVFRKRYEEMHAEREEDRFLYGSHYSYGGSVLFYLCRLEPYATMALKLQGGKWDHPDRMFSSVAATYDGVLNGPTDVKELTPEWFTTPDFLRNHNRIQFGNLQDGASVGDVVLPPWAKGDAHRFVHINRMALESQCVSRSLHKWVDLVFGFKQKGAAAVEANNVFYHLTYEGAVDWAKVDPDERESLQMQIQAFGQTPSQLFPKKPHPARTVDAVMQGRGLGTAVSHNCVGLELHSDPVTHGDGGAAAPESGGSFAAVPPPALRSGSADGGAGAAAQDEWTVVEVSQGGKLPSVSKFVATSRIDLTGGAGGGTMSSLAARASVLTSMLILPPVGAGPGDLYADTGGYGLSGLIDLGSSTASVFALTTSLNFYNVKIDMVSQKLTSKEGFSFASKVTEGAAGVAAAAADMAATLSPSPHGARAPAAAVTHAVTPVANASYSNATSQSLSGLVSWSPWCGAGRDLTLGDSVFEVTDDRFHASHRLAHDTKGRVFLAGCWDGRLRIIHNKKPNTVLASRALDKAVDWGYDPGMATCVDVSDPFLVVGTSLGIVVVFVLLDRKTDKKATATIPPVLKHTQTIRGHSGFITCVAVNQVLDVVASSSSTGDVLLHSVREGTLLRSLSVPAFNSPSATSPLAGRKFVRRLLIEHSPPHTAYPMVVALCEQPAGGDDDSSFLRHPKGIIGSLDLGDGLQQKVVAWDTNGAVLLDHSVCTPGGHVKVRDICCLSLPVPLVCLVGGNEDGTKGFSRLVELHGGGVVVTEGVSHLQLSCAATFTSCQPLPVQVGGGGAAVFGTSSGSLLVFSVDKGLRADSQRAVRVAAPTPAV